MSENNFFTNDQLIELEKDLIEELTAQGLAIEEIRLIGLKGHGYHATVFSVLINGVHHVLKIYREPEAFAREVKHLHKVIPKQRFLFVWKAELNRMGYNIVITEVPDGHEMGPRNLTPEIAKSLAEHSIGLHSIKSRHKISVKSLKVRFEELRPSVVAHAKEYDDLNPDELSALIDEAKAYLEENNKHFRRRKSRTHGDLWWANVIVAEEDVYLIDWERLRMADYCEDLAKFTVLFNIVRPTEPRTFWSGGQPQPEALEQFLGVIHKAYRTRFPNTFFEGRYGIYCLLYGLKQFGDYYFWDKKGSTEAYNMLKTGIAYYRRFVKEAAAK